MTPMRTDQWILLDRDTGSQPLDPHRWRHWRMETIRTHQAPPHMWHQCSQWNTHTGNHWCCKTEATEMTHLARHSSTGVNEDQATHQYRILHFGKDQRHTHWCWSHRGCLWTQGGRNRQSSSADLYISRHSGRANWRIRWYPLHSWDLGRRRRLFWEWELSSEIM